MILVKDRLTSDLTLLNNPFNYHPHEKDSTRKTLLLYYYFGIKNSYGYSYENLSFESLK